MDHVHAVAERVKKEREELLDATRIILDAHLNKRDTIMAQRARMGGSDSYIGSVSLEWLAGRVGYAHQLPLFTSLDKVETRDEGAEPTVMIDDATINQIMQRPLDWSRQAVLAHYLADRQWHKFPPVLVVATQEWVDDPEALEWSAEGRATKASVGFTGLDSEGRVGLLDVSEDYFLYALDGQHRLMGIQGLMELKAKGKLARRKKNGQPTTKQITKEELSVDASRLQALGNERIGMEVIAAVMPGETHEEAKRRVRSIFVHVNMMASSLSKGQLAQLDEDNGFSIVARSVATSHPLLDKEDRVDFTNTSIPTRSIKVTTLQTLTEMATNYLAPRFVHWESNVKDLVPLRPNEEELTQGVKLFSELFDMFRTLPSIVRLEQGTHPTSLRNFSTDDPKGEGHMLFRPVGQVALADALGQLVFGRALKLESLFAKLREYDDAGGFRMEDPGSLWHMVLFDPTKNRMTVRGRALATKLLVYLLKGGEPNVEERAELRKALAAERVLAEGEARRFDGGLATFDARHHNGIPPKDIIDLPPAL